MAVTMSYSKDGRVVGAPAREKLKTSDLPLASATRSTIDGLQRTFKKKGGYDSLRQQVWQELKRSVSIPCCLVMVDLTHSLGIRSKLHERTVANC
ncbi:hypothetical protein B0O99DRAFT_642341 [Bisporella sp. PMI_857]|nr:hypothetical protein B0O99DRAFT_642341 [Bisporella sp. PMI_857]